VCRYAAKPRTADIRIVDHALERPGSVAHATACSVVIVDTPAASRYPTNWPSSTRVDAGPA
jgi:hypothetical protein